MLAEGTGVHHDRLLEQPCRLLRRYARSSNRARHVARRRRIASGPGRLGPQPLLDARDRFGGLFVDLKLDAGHQQPRAFRLGIDAQHLAEIRQRIFHLAAVRKRGRDTNSWLRSGRYEPLRSIPQTRDHGCRVCSELRRGGREP